MPEMSIREAISLGLREALDAWEEVFLMGEDIGAYGGAYAVTKGFLQRYGKERVRDTPISESAFVGAGIGAALAGLRPVVELMTINFSLLASDQIINHAAKLRYMSGGQLKVPLIIRTVTGGGGQLGATHSQSLEGLYASIPGLKVVCPATPYDALGLLRSCFLEENPVLYCEHALLYGVRGPVPEEPYTVPIGKADIKRPGRDLTIVAYSRMVHVALGAAKRLEERGLEAEVVDLRSLRPLDIDTVVESVRRTHRLVVVEEAWDTGGFGAYVGFKAQELAFDYLDGPVVRVAGADVPAPYNRTLEWSAIPDEGKVVRAVEERLGL